MTFVRSQHSFPKARIEHTCQMCEKTIKPGEQYFREDGFYKDEDGKGVICNKACWSCFYPEIADGMTCGMIAHWAQQFGAEVDHRDHSYNIGHIRIPESYTDVRLGGELFTLEYVHGGGPDREIRDDFVKWLMKHPTVPDISFLLESEEDDG